MHIDRLFTQEVLSWVDCKHSVVCNPIRRIQHEETKTWRENLTSTASTAN